MAFESTSSAGDIIPANGNNGQVVVQPGHFCAQNSTATPLLAGASWTGTAADVTNMNGISVFVTSDVDSATGGLEVQYSEDGLTDWVTAESYTIVAGAEKWFTPPAFGIYFRLKYTNGGTDQTSFKISTKFSPTPFKWSSHNIEDPITDQDDAELTKSVITGKKADGDYDNVSLTNGGNMKVSLEEIESGISTNSNSQLNTSPYILDEYGNYNHQLGDNGFKGAIIAIPPEHHEIHCGDSYTAHHVADLSNGATLNYLVTTPNWGDPVNGSDPMGNQAIKVAHLVGEISGESETEFWLYESPTVTGAGTSLTSVNRNRNSSNTDVLTISYGATVSADGTELEHGKFGSGKSIGGAVGRTDEWVLANNTTYLLRVNNSTTSNNYHTLRFQYYIHPGV